MPLGIAEIQKRVRVAFHHRAPVRGVEGVVTAGRVQLTALELGLDSLGDGEASKLEIQLNRGRLVSPAFVPRKNSDRNRNGLSSAATRTDRW